MSSHYHNNLIWIELDKQAFVDNLINLKKHIGPDVSLAPCLKSNAYGHGVKELAPIVVNYSDWICVNSLVEAEELFKERIDCPILIMGPLVKDDYTEAIRRDFHFFISDKHSLSVASSAALKLNKLAKIHIKIDTGMSRQGFLPSTLNGILPSAQKLPNIEVEALCTHFATADEPEDQLFFKEQFTKFIAIKNIFPNYRLYHCANSAATLLHPETHLNLVRPGIAVYGLWPSQSTKTICAEKNIELKPILSLKTTISLIKNIPSGSCVSYGCSFVAVRKMRIAILPIGYYDGLPRKLSNKGYVLIRGKRAKILGRVCMNLCVVDISDINDAVPGDEVVIIGQQKDDEITVDELAEHVGTINYEITTRLRNNIPKFLV